MAAGGVAAWTALVLCCFAVVILPLWSYLLYNDLSSFELPISVSKQDAATSCLVAAVIYSIVGIGCVIFILSDYVFMARGGRASIAGNYRHGYSSGHHRQVEMKPLLDDHNDMSDAGSRTSSQTMSSHGYSGDPFDNPSPLGVSKEEGDNSHNAFLSYHPLGNPDRRKLTRNYHFHSYHSASHRESSPITREVAPLDLLREEPTCSSPPNRYRHSTPLQQSNAALLQSPFDDLLAGDMGRHATADFPDSLMPAAAPTPSTPPVFTPQQPSVLTSHSVLSGLPSSLGPMNSPPAAPIDHRQGSYLSVSLKGLDSYTARPFPPVSFQNVPNLLSSPLLFARDAQSLDSPTLAAVKKVPPYRKGWDVNAFLEAQA